MRNFTHVGHVAVVRPANGHYKHPESDRWRVYAEIFGDHPVTGSEFREFVLDRIWNKLHRIQRDPGIGVICEVNGYTRPLFDIMLDVYEALGRYPARRTVLHTRALFGDRAGEFLDTLDRVYFAYSQETIDDLDYADKHGHLRVDPVKPVREAA